MNMLIRVCVLLACVLPLGSCGNNYEERVAYIDKCVIEAGLQSECNNVKDYCNAKWHESQREKAKASE